ncbi:MAG: 50S ribosomal protein L10 [Oscillospiraceae bacterium]|nr:50S ribosomal protein L10 [Oscillospiraceae bacterium]
MPSEKILEQKKQAVAELSAKLKESCVGVVVDYKGISVADDTKLRKEIRESGATTYAVVKNTLLSRALKDAGIEGMDDVLEGTTAIAYSNEDYTAGARILNNYAEKSKTFNIKAGFIDGKVVSKEEVEKLAKIPSKEGLIAQILYGLNANIAGLARAIQAVADKKSEEGEVA